MLFHVFLYQNLICYFSIWWKEEHQQLISYYKLIELLYVDFLTNVRKNCHVWSCSIPHTFFGICGIYLDNSLLTFYFGCDIKKKLKWYFYLIETINTSVKSVLRHIILTYFTGKFFQCGISSYNQIMPSQHIPPNLQGLLSCFLLMLKRHCIRVWLCKLVCCAN